MGRSSKTKFSVKQFLKASCYITEVNSIKKIDLRNAITVLFNNTAQLFSMNWIFHATNRNVFPVKHNLRKISRFSGSTLSCLGRQEGSL